MLEDDARKRIMVALDCDASRATELAGFLAGKARWLKVGMTLYYAAGPSIVEELKSYGFSVFLDLKLHDIPHQVRGAARSAVACGADMITVHTVGGVAMMEAAVEGAREGAGVARTASVIGVTVLTSMDLATLATLGIVVDAVQDQVLRLACLARTAGLDGVVSSPHEAALLRRVLGEEPCIVTPGVRPSGASANDQSRVATPAEAFGAGASHLVIGRPITAAKDPLSAYESIIEALKEA